MSKKLELDANGNYPFFITFNYRDEDNGYMLGIPRNYPTKKVKELVNSSKTKKWIDNGNAVIMYGHGTRNISKNRYVPAEHNPHNGEVQLPIGKITKLSINPKNHNLIDFEGFFIPTKENKVESIVKFIENGLGGFSFIWHVPRGIFYGADYVLVQNFSSNKVTLDALDDYCTDGECPIDATVDNLVEDIRIPYDLYNDAIHLLKNQEEIIAIQEVVKKIRDLELSLSGKSEYISKIESENSKLLKKVKKLTEDLLSQKELLEAETLESKALLDAIDEIGEVEEVEGKVSIRTKGLSELFKPAGKNLFEEFDPSKLVKVNKVKKDKGDFEWSPKLHNLMSL